MNNAITLEQLDYKYQSKILDIIHKDMLLKETFGGMENTKTRIINSNYVGLIKKNKKVIGFIMLVYNEKTNDLEIDMGIVEKYRCKGYATKSLKVFKSILEQNNIKVTAQIKNNNLPMIKTVTNNEFILIKKDSHYNYYKNI